MKQLALTLLLCAVTIQSEVAVAAEPTSSTPRVVGQALSKLEVPGRIAAAIWTRRDSHFTLQIMRREDPGQMRVASRADSFPAGARFVGDVQIWLLRADGTIVSPTRRSESPGKASCIAAASGPKPCLGYEIMYSFPLASGAEAVAIAMSLGDTFVIEKLPFFP